METMYVTFIQGQGRENQDWVERWWGMGAMQSNAVMRTLSGYTKGKEKQHELVHQCLSVQATYKGAFGSLYGPWLASG
jgi:hypothetical protein